MSIRMLMTPVEEESFSLGRRCHPLPEGEGPRLRCSPFLSLLLLRCLICFAPPRAAQNVFQRVIVFVAGVLINMLIGCGPGELAGPGTSPGCRILDGEPIKQCVRRDAGK